MSVPEAPYRPDWPSRILAFFSLLLAALAIGYLVMQGQVTATRDSLRQQFSTQLDAAMANQQSRISDVLADARQSVDTWKTEANLGVQNVLAAARSEIQQAASDQVAAMAQTDRQQEQRIAALEQQVARIEVARPPLPSVVVTFRPVLEDPASVEIVNEGPDPVVVDRVRFTPAEIEELDESLVASSTAGTEVLFTKDDNLSSEPDTHGVYQHKLAKPLTIPSHGSETLHVAIRNGPHQGYALVGELALDTQDAELLRVPNLTAPFLAP